MNPADSEEAADDCSAGLIAVDWGLSSFRAARIDAAGRIVDSMQAGRGILRVADGDFEGAFLELLQPWLSAWPEAEVILCGMIGSRQGWVEAPYAPCPAGRAELAARMVPLRLRMGLVVRFVPGVADEREPEVMRGEETQIIGALPDRPEDRAVFCLPGTHCKWAVVEKGRIMRFHTFMTGEVFAVLKQHSILGRLMRESASEDEAAFAQGLDRAAQAGGLLNHLFSVRTLGLFNRIPDTALASYLSGLVIGHEILGALARMPRVDRVTLIGAPALCRRYATALERHGIDGRMPEGDAAARGIHRIAMAAQGTGTER